ncbi:Ribokinase [Phaffia rhodozyma]|uniref:Ribokinase n=1 Tax=Phaffia rhodozyma TaxID=264483 RepID=A0A0F7SUF5_PHARH|nr:Ribokinase [Phaffia rhodozyma]
MPAEPLCLVRGSINVDEFFHLPHIVRPGETISSTSLSRRAGGKGANQACAVARSAGGPVRLIGAVGADGIWAKDLLESYGVDVDGVVVQKDGVTGRAVIQLDGEGENCIILYQGANHAELPLPSEFSPRPSHLLLQNEIPLPQTLHYLSLCPPTSSSSEGTSAIFNPSPMLSSEEIASFPWWKLGWLIVNEGEMEDLLKDLSSSSDSSSPSADIKHLKESIETIGEAAPEKYETFLPTLLQLARHKSLQPPAGSHKTTSPSIVLTLGSAGSFALLSPSGPSGRYGLIYTPASKLQGETRDTTGAGDCFAGFLVGGLMRLLGEGKSESDQQGMRDVMRVATQAAGMCVESHGAQEAVPEMKSVQARLAAL